MEVSAEDLKLRVQIFLSSFSERSPRADVVQRLIASLDIDTADTAKRLRIGQEIENLNQPGVRENFKTPAGAGDELLKRMRA